MFDYIIGNLEETGVDYAVIENSGIGYVVYISRNSALSLPHIKSEIKLYTYVKIKEESIILYGFLSKTERELYLNLTSVSGVGPKAAMAILGSNTADKIITAIINNDAKLLSASPGIGIKTANRIIVDLKDKFKDFNNLTAADIVSNANVLEKNVCVDALVTLGYSYSKAALMTDKTFKETETTENNILAALSIADSI